MKNIIFFIVLSLLFVSVSNAELIVRGTDSLGYQLIYDTDRNITWYDYASSEADWQNQMNWASELTVNFGGFFYKDWQLPIIGYPSYCQGLLCPGSMVAHLYFDELGNKAYQGLTNTGDFQHLLSYNWYWTQTTWTNNEAWAFDLFSGRKASDTKDDPLYAIAMRYGDVASPVVPEPISSTLFIVGGAMLAGRRYLRKKK